MTEREKVIKGLECCLNLSDRCPDECLECPYRSDKDCEVTCMQKMGKDALNLLEKEKKEQKKTKPLTLEDLNNIYVENRYSKAIVPITAFSPEIVINEITLNLCRMWLGYPTEEERSKREWEDVR